MKRRRILELTASGLVIAGPDHGLNASSRDRLADEPEENDREDFDPAVDGFGFANWAGETGEGGDGEAFTLEHQDVTLSDVQEAIQESWRTAFSEAQRAIMSRIVLSWIGSNAATNGHCYGMMFAADYYFQNPAGLPEGAASASEIPRPTDDYQAVGDRIRRFQTSQLLRAEPYWFGLLGLRWGLADHEESLEQVIEAIEETGTAGLAIDGEANPHQVLAHDYEHADGVTAVDIYDPTYEAAEHEEAGGVWQLVVDPESGEVIEMTEGYDEFLYHDPGIDISIVDRLIGGRNYIIGEVSNAVFLGLESAGSLEIDVPEDVFVDRPAAAYADPSMGPFADAAVVFGTPDAIGVSIDGETGIDYALDVIGLRAGELVLDGNLTDTLEEVPAELEITLDDAGELVIEAVEEAAEAEGTDRDWFEENWWVLAGGGALGVGAGYWFLQEKDER